MMEVLPYFRPPALWSAGGGAPRAEGRLSGQSKVIDTKVMKPPPPSTAMVASCFGSNTFKTTTCCHYKWRIRSAIREVKNVTRLADSLLQVTIDFDLRTPFSKYI